MDTFAIIAKDRPVFREWLLQMLIARGKGGRAELAAYLGLDPSAMSLITRGRRAIKADELAKMIEFFTEVPPFFRHYGSGIQQPDAAYIGFAEGAVLPEEVPVRGDIANGRWSARDAGPNRLVGTSSPLNGVSLFPGAQAWVVRDSSLRRVAREGDYLICREVGEGGFLPHGALAVIQRTYESGDLVETSVRRVWRYPDRTDFLLDSPDENFNETLSIAVGDTASPIKVCGLVVGLYRDLQAADDDAPAPPMPRRLKWK